MKKIFFTLCCIFSLYLSNGQNSTAEYNKFIKKADSLFKLKEYKNSGIAYSDAFKTKGNKGRFSDRYQAARSWAMANVPDSAFDCLERNARKRHITTIDSLQNESDFKSLHNDKRWTSLLEFVKECKKYEIPDGWSIAGSKRESYMMGTDKGSGREGNNAATIRSLDEKIDGFGTLMQSFEAGKYLGKKVRMTGYIKSKNVAQWSGLWLRVDRAASNKSVSFDNMSDRPITGTTDWKKYEIVLMVPENASKLAFGALVHGVGQIWFDNISFEIVDNSVPVTGKLKAEPTNLNFEK